MHGDDLAWLLFWWSIFAGFMCNVIVGVGLTIAFIVLQRQSEIKNSLRPFWSLADREYNLLIYAMDSSETFVTDVIRLHDELMREFEAHKDLLDEFLPKHSAFTLRVALNSMVDQRRHVSKPEVSLYLSEPEVTRHNDAGEEVVETVPYMQWLDEFGTDEQQADYVKFWQVQNANEALMQPILLHDRNPQKPRPPLAVLPKLFRKRVTFLRVLRHVVSEWFDDLSPRAMYAAWRKLVDDLDDRPVGEE